MAEPNVDEPVGEDVSDSSGIDWSGLSESMELRDEDEPLSTEVEEEAPATNEAPEPEGEEEPTQDLNEDFDSAEPEPEPEPEAPPELEPLPEAAQAPEQLQVPQQPQQQEPQAQTPQAPQQDPEELARLREQWVSQVAQNYQLSDEDQNNLITDPNSVLPQLAANLHAQVYEEVLQAVGQMIQSSLPTYLDQWSSQREQSRQGEDAFFSKWPELKEHKERVMSIAQVYRNVNPQASVEQFIQDVGVQAWMALGLEPAKLASKLSPEPQPEAAPAPRRQAGYRPAPPNPAPPPQAPSNPFADLADQWNEDF